MKAFFEKLYGEHWSSTSGVGNFNDILTNKDANALIADFVARKIRRPREGPQGR